MPFKRLAVLLLAILSVTANAQTSGLNFRPSGAAYSTALDCIIFTAGNPNQLHIYDAVTQTDQTVALQAAPQSLSLSPDGLYAAVGFTSAVSYVNLTAASISRTFSNVPVGAGVVIVGSGYIYVLNYTTGIVCIEIASGQMTTFAVLPNIFSGVFNLSLNTIYGAQIALSEFLRVRL